MSLLEVLDEQISVGFSGRVNLLASVTREFLGAIYINHGELIEVNYGGVNGEKAFYRLITKDYQSPGELKYIVEPEVISVIRKIHRPYSVMKRRADEMIKAYLSNQDKRPANHLKIMINPDVLTNSVKITETEFRLLSTISDYSEVEQIYKNSTLLDFEITNSLVSLRKKRALKVIGRKR